MKSLEIIKIKKIKGKYNDYSYIINILNYWEIRGHTLQPTIFRLAFQQNLNLDYSLDGDITPPIYKWQNKSQGDCDLYFGYYKSLRRKSAISSIDASESRNIKT